MVKFPDAVVGFVEARYSVDEDSGEVEVCVDSGVSEGFQTELAISITGSSGNASE